MTPTTPVAVYQSGHTGLWHRHEGPACTGTYPTETQAREGISK